MQREIRKCGNTHWADNGDLKALSEKLGVGILLLANNLQNNNTQCLVSLDQRKGNFPFFASIWWNDPVHFRVAELSFDSGASFSCFWQPVQIPDNLRHHYDVCNPHARIGAEAALDIS